MTSEVTHSTLPVNDLCDSTFMVWGDSIDQHIRMFLTGGGIDDSGLYWLGQSTGDKFSQALGKQLTAIPNYKCSLEHPCNSDLNCHEIGARSGYDAGGAGLNYPPSSGATLYLQVYWGFLTLIAVQNINQQLSNQYVAIKGALGVLALDTFLIGDFFPSPDARFNIINALTGLGTILSIISGFVPVIGPGIATTGSILPAMSTFLGNAAAMKKDPLIGQKDFPPRVRELYTNYVNTLDEAGNMLLGGDKISGASGSFDISDIMAHGVWLNSSALNELISIKTNLTLDILSRSIDALWKTAPSNKMWIMYVNLDDDLSA